MNLSPDAGEQAALRLVTFTEFKPRKGIPYTRQYIDRLERDGRFPTRVRTGANSVAWIEDELDLWIRSLPRGKIRDRRSERGRDALDRAKRQPERGKAGRSP
jgi:predicted DNA-binding transcriptional regulator AlpA